MIDLYTGFTYMDLVTLLSKYSCLSLMLFIGIFIIAYNFKSSIIRNSIVAFAIPVFIISFALFVMNFITISLIPVVYLYIFIENQILIYINLYYFGNVFVLKIVLFLVLVFIYIYIIYRAIENSNDNDKQTNE